jgi:catechol 2,3-dioxygenase-like lactoylglutathione lyase family enzyme
MEGPSGRSRVTGVSELVLEVVDLEASEAFYAGLLGLPVVDRWPDREAIWVMAGGRGGVHVHFALHLAPEDYEAAVAPLRADPAFLQEQRFPGADDSRAAYLRDPDGNVVELWTWDVGRHLGVR